MTSKNAKKKFGDITIDIIVQLSNAVYLYFSC